MLDELSIPASLRNSSLVAASAKALRINPVYFHGHLVTMWEGAALEAEDGDLWRGNEDSTRRFIASLACFHRGSALFIDVLQQDGWLNGWLIRDWLAMAGKTLINKYKTGNRPLLEAIWRKHGRVYGRPNDGTGTEVERKQTGSGTEAPPAPLNPRVRVITKTLNPPTLETKEINNPNPDPNPDPPGDSGFSNFVSSGSRVQGVSGLAGALPCAGFSDEDVFEAFRTPLKFHGIHSSFELGNRVRHCKVDAARWMMLFLDKLEYCYKEVDGAALIDTEDADPVALTVAGFVPRPGRNRHEPTDAARLFFTEVMNDRAKALAGRKARWNGNLTGPAVALEVGRRKGSRKKFRKDTS